MEDDEEHDDECLLQHNVCLHMLSMHAHHMQCCKHMFLYCCMHMLLVTTMVNSLASISTVNTFNFTMVTPPHFTISPITQTRTLTGSYPSRSASCSACITRACPRRLVMASKRAGCSVSRLRLRWVRPASCSAGSFFARVSPLDVMATACCGSVKTCCHML